MLQTFNKNFVFVQLNLFSDFFYKIALLYYKEHCVQLIKYVMDTSSIHFEKSLIAYER